MAATRPEGSAGSVSTGKGTNKTTSRVEDVHRPLDLKLLARGWHSANREYNYWVPEADVSGAIPHELRGTLFRNGPGLMEVYGKKLIHRELNLINC